jgi:hypothetical protein
MKPFATTSVLLLMLLATTFAGNPHRRGQPPPNQQPSGAVTGLAAKYPGDKGIANDPAVLMVEDFESYPERTSGNALATARKAGTNPTGKLVMQGKPFGTWSDKGHTTFSSIVTDAEHGKVWQCSVPPNLGYEANDSFEVVAPVTTPMGKTVYFRWYQKWNADYAVVGSNHNGALISGGVRPRSPGKTPPANGSGWWTFILDHNAMPHANMVAPTKGYVPKIPGDSPYWWHIYAYYAGYSGNKWLADGYQVHGGTSDILPKYQFTDNRHYPDFTAQSCAPLTSRNEWHCYELMVKCNTISNGSGPHDGEVKVWIDGVPRGHFTDLFFAGTRATDPYSGSPLLISDFALMEDITRSQTKATPTIKWYDNIVVATQYIGPIAPAK